METEPKGLEASLEHLIDLHHHKSLVLAHHTDKAKKDAIRKAEHVSDLLVEAVNGGVQDSFINQKRIELEIRTLATTITRFMKQTDQWLAATHALNTALKVYCYSLLSFIVFLFRSICCIYNILRCILYNFSYFIVFFIVMYFLLLCCALGMSLGNLYGLEGTCKKATTLVTIVGVSLLWC